MDPDDFAQLFLKVEPLITAKTQNSVQQHITTASLVRKVENCAFPMFACITKWFEVLCHGTTVSIVSALLNPDSFTIFIDIAVLSVCQYQCLNVNVLTRDKNSRYFVLHHHGK